MPYDSLENMENLLFQLNDQVKRQTNFIEEGTCQMCSHSLAIKDIVVDGVAQVVTYNGKKYHSFCINFWLNKVLSANSSLN